jgi:hypothetical protein
VELQIILSTEQVESTLRERHTVYWRAASVVESGMASSLMLICMRTLLDHHFRSPVNKNTFKGQCLALLNHHFSSPVNKNRFKGQCGVERAISHRRWGNCTLTKAQPHGYKIEKFERKSYANQNGGAISL